MPGGPGAARFFWQIDGCITAEEWLLYDVKSDLAGLSACDAGVGRAQAGEREMGLPYALFIDVQQ